MTATALIAFIFGNNSALTVRRPPESSTTTSISPTTYINCQDPDINPGGNPQDILRKY